MSIAHRRKRHRRKLIRQSPTRKTIRRFANAQAINVHRSAEALRPFTKNEFGTESASPSPAQIDAANALIGKLRKSLISRSTDVTEIARIVSENDRSSNLNRLLYAKTRSIKSVKAVEKIWDFYFEVFGQRLTRFAPMLLAADRIARDCYQVFYTGIGVAVTVPTPPPMTYMETGFSPATYRRGVRLSRLGKQINPFPLIQLPYHRLVNPWTLGAIHHETGHNLQSDRDLWREVPQRIYYQLRKQGMNQSVARSWTRWHKELWADLIGVLLGGPGIVASLIDVIARSPSVTMSFNPMAVHPIPYFRGLMNFELLRRMGFSHTATDFEHLWKKLYPHSRSSRIPRSLLDSYPVASKIVLDMICFEPYSQLGNKALIEVVTFRPEHQAQIREAAQRLAQGNDPGIIPERFLVGAMREALDNHLASPQRIAASFYEALNQR